MGRCKICGKKGFFLQIYGSGRCKKCEEKYLNEQRRLKRIEEEKRVRLEEERLEKEKSEIQDAKKQLYKILDMIILLDGELYLVLTDDCEKFLPIIDKRIEQSCELCELIWNAKKNPYFFDVLKQYAYSNDEKKKYRLLGIQCGLRNQFEMEYQDPGFLAINYLEHFSDEFEKAWKKEKKEVEKYLNKKKCPKAKSNSITDFKGKVKNGVEKDSREENDLNKRNFEILPDCVITDIETSGLIYNKNSIIEIAAIKVINGKIMETYSSLIHRDKPLSSKITNLTGITTKMLRDCEKDVDEVMSEYRDFIGDLPLVGHNIEGFDIKFINEAYLKVWGEEIKNQSVDTLKLSYEYFDDVESHKLGDLADYAEIPKGSSHRALGDCETTLCLYEYMMKKAMSIFLNWSKKGKKIDESNMDYPKYIKSLYPLERCSEYHRKIMTSGYLEKAKPEELLNTFKAQELKDILQERSLPIKGAKAVLISRIIENMDISDLDLPEVYVPSKKGIEFLNLEGNI